jgi:hypothetical protein
MSETTTAADGVPERIGKWIGDGLAGLIMLAIVVMMIVQFA